MAAKTTANLNLTATNNTDRAFRQVNSSLKNTARSLQIVQGPLGPVAGRFTALASAMGSISPVSLGVTGAVVGMTFAFKKGIEEFSKTEKQLLQLEAQLKATGSAAGKTGDELEDMAQTVARSTLESLEGVRQAQGILLSFRTITEDTFDRALVAATDLSAAGFGSVTDAAKQLGKALEDPLTGLSSLRRAGVTFSADQKEVIKSLIETGQRAEAMSLILDGIGKQVGGAGAGAGGGVAGRFDSLSQSVENFWNAIGDWANNTGFLGWLDTASDLAQDLADALSDIDSLSLKGLESDYQEQLDLVRNLRNELDNLREDDTPNNRTKALISRKRADLEDAINALQEFENELKKRGDDSFKADRNREIAQDEIAAAEAAARAAAAAEEAAKRRAKAEAELVKWHKAQYAEYLKQQKALDEIAARLDPIGAATQSYLDDWQRINDSSSSAADKQMFLNLLTEEYKETLSDIKDTAEELTEQEQKALDAATDFAQTLGDGLKAATLEGKNFGEVMNNILGDIADQLADLLIIQPLVQAVAGASQPFFQSLLGGKASGGTDLKEGRYRVGEAGPEVVEPPKGERYLVGDSGPEIIQISQGSNIIPMDEFTGRKEDPFREDESGAEIITLSQPMTTSTEDSSQKEDRTRRDESGPDSIKLSPSADVIPFDPGSKQDPAPLISGKASGGTNLKEGRYRVGEAGAEIVELPQGSNIIPMDQVSSPAPKITVNVVNNGEPAEIQTETESLPNGDQMINVILNKVAESVTNNGVVGRSMKSAFNTRQRAIVR